VSIFFCACSSNIWAITQTLAGPKAAGRWTGFQNFVGNLAGMVAPAITGLVLDRTGQFYWAFAILTAVALIGMCSWLFLVGPVQQVVWRKRPHATALRERSLFCAIPVSLNAEFLLLARCISVLRHNCSDPCLFDEGSH
jgi:hypothetical protein